MNDPNQIAKINVAILAMAALGIANANGYESRRSAPRKPDNPLKPCLQCMKLTTHNKQFCSAECCGQHRRSRK